MNKTYKHTDEVHNFVAPREIVPLMMKLVQANSVLDVGCGTGTWLKVFEEYGVSDYVGVDGDYVDLKTLKISIDHFVAHDLQQPLRLNRKFDLVVSLEVAEHLEERWADQYVDSLVRHGDVILFSAAIPFQGGQNHLNEQWPDYWQRKFERHGYFFQDCIRPAIWENQNVEWWYRQNTFLLTKRPPQGDSGTVRSMVHPKLFRQIISDQSQYNKSLREGKQGLKISTEIFVNAISYKLKKLFGLK